MQAAIFVAVVDASVAENILSQVKKWKHGAAAAIKSNIGGQRVVNMLAGKQLPTIC